MNSSRTRTYSAFALALAIVLSVVCWEGAAQNASSGLSQAGGASSTPRGMSPEAAKVWNSPQMVRARGWLDDYLSKSAKITPQEAAEYKAELERLSPKQMKLWLLRFDHEEQQRQAQYHAFQQANNMAMAHARAFQKATQQALANVSQGETAAAEEGQSQVNAQQRDAERMQEDKLDELNAPNLTGPGFGYWGGPYGYGGVHYHLHVYQ